MADAKTVIELMGAGLTALGAVTVTALRFHKKVMVPLTKWVAQAEETNRIVKEQLTANGGSSLRDAVLRIEETAQAHHASIHGFMTLHVEHGIFETDKVGNCVWVNPIYRVWTGRTLDELTGEGWLGIVYPLDRKAVSEAWEIAVDQGRDFQGIYRFQNFEGHAFWVSCTAIVTRFNGKNFGYLGRVVKCEAPETGQAFL